MAFLPADQVIVGFLSSVVSGSIIHFFARQYLLQHSTLLSERGWDVTHTRVASG